MLKVHLLPALAGLWLAAAACAQDNQAGMARAQRAADNPLRMIIEAAKLAKPRPRPAAAAAAAASAAPPSAAAASTKPVAAAPVPVVEPAAPPEPAAGAPEPPAAAAPSEPVVQIADTPIATVVVPAVEPEPLPVKPAEPIVTLPSAEAALPPLKLVNVVEPAVPRPLIGRLRGEIEAVISFTVNPDGSVSGAEVQSSSHKQMDASVLEAVQQWRYEPIATARSHSVRLVLRQPG